ncbi:hypothetical protein BT96DRAFT_914739 [Gymnopus androsaceus JB14]|uniref:Tat pathway signal sequence n=1 Tax=Gymnopus androsaceus JB14 TaxID=1447944 RepID=A0A6A4I9Y6_9AGAR|nr:hypothetical protein BT96DRAFT_914739 [Gymnopus androsaceus JB14]
MVCTNFEPSPSLTSLVYSPAHTAFRYEVHQFSASFGSYITEYQGPPTEALDEKWHDLYRYGISQISGSEAEKLVDKTVPIPGDEDNYIISLEVFHQLHCLNLLRKSLYPDHYPTELFIHLEHCVDIIRQALLCNVDITPIPWRWSEFGQITVPRMDGSHGCVDFASIQKWAYDHQLRTEFNSSINLDLGSGVTSNQE